MTSAASELRSRVFGLLKNPKFRAEGLTKPLIRTMLDIDENDRNAVWRVSDALAKLVHDGDVRLESGIYFAKGE